jgi:hypothetical protein
MKFWTRTVMYALQRSMFQVADFIQHEKEDTVSSSIPSHVMKSENVSIMGMTSDPLGNNFYFSAESW